MLSETGSWASFTPPFSSRGPSLEIYSDSEGPSQCIDDIQNYALTHTSNILPSF